MRFLFTAGALHGHVNPMLPLAVAAQRAGHEVAFATGPDMAPQVDRAGLECWPVGMTHAQAGGNDQASWIDYFVRTARARAEHLVPRALQWRPTWSCTKKPNSPVPSPRPRATFDTTGFTAWD